jgi:hypothetical protein
MQRLTALYYIYVRCQKYFSRRSRDLFLSNARAIQPLKYNRISTLCLTYRIGKEAILTYFLKNSARPVPNLFMSETNRYIVGAVWGTFLFYSPKTYDKSIG